MDIQNAYVIRFMYCSKLIRLDCRLSIKVFELEVFSAHSQRNLPLLVGYNKTPQLDGRVSAMGYLFVDLTNMVRFGWPELRTPGLTVMLPEAHKANRVVLVAVVAADTEGVIVHFSSIRLVLTFWTITLTGCGILHP